LTGCFCSDITSIGCHTALWDFEKKAYHRWVVEEGILAKLAEIKPPGCFFDAVLPGTKFLVGAGLHDSSAALIPYLKRFQEPFVLISTGTWSISMNPFNHSRLTGSELENECLCYLSFSGDPVKSSRLFAGHDHDEQLKRIAERFNTDITYFRDLPFSAALVKDEGNVLLRHQTAAEAYHQLIGDLIQQQVRSTNLILTPGVKKIYVDGGFSRNRVFMNLLARAYPELEVFAASMAQASALGAAIAIHHCWNAAPLPGSLIQLKRY
jgi:sugar (pentulose or hexulose) kinase